MRILLLDTTWCSRLINLVAKSGFFGNFARFWKHLFTDNSLLILCRPNILFCFLIHHRFTALCVLVISVVYRCRNFTGQKVIEHLEVYLNEFGWLERACDNSLLWLFRRLSGLLWSGRNIWIWSCMAAELVLLMFAGQILARSRLPGLSGKRRSICTRHKRKLLWILPLVGAYLCGRLFHGSFASGTNYFRIVLIEHIIWRQFIWIARNVVLLCGQARVRNCLDQMFGSISSSLYYANFRLLNSCQLFSEVSVGHGCALRLALEHTLSFVKGPADTDRLFVYCEVMTAFILFAQLL